MSTQMGELPVCPFCKAAPIVGYMGDEDGGYGYVECANQGCGDGHFAGVHGDDEDDARKVWEQLARTSGNEVLIEAEFLCARLREFEGELRDDEVATEFFGHVSPPLARLQAAIAALSIPSSTREA